MRHLGEKIGKLVLLTVWQRNIFGAIWTVTLEKWYVVEDGQFRKERSACPCLRCFPSMQLEEAATAEP